MGRYRIVLADDHVLLRQGLKRILEKMANLEIAGEAGNGLELLNLLRKLKANMIILDISMPNLRGIEAIQEIKAIDPALKILILTMHKDKEYLHQAISAGADGYLLKEDADTELFAAIETVREGKIYVSPHLANDSVDEWAKICRGELKIVSEPERLTTREKEILKLIAEGKASKEIAALLCISARTVEHHRANLMSKLNMRKTAELVKYAIKKGLT